MEMTSEALKKSELHTGQVRVDDFGEPCLIDSEIPGTSVIGRMFGNMNSVIRDLLRPLNADFTSIGVDDFGEPVFIQTQRQLQFQKILERTSEWKIKGYNS
ncbi:uncharacterized protein LOC106059946 isoform X1 [Biomphalaria glabrata]|uniref:Uncharacterized protein LOC106059946 isoform X1 n=1 Tax=Biomphalaria glabrata TaxID=6526 RepID=A0A9W2Z9N0_BIOGL|nr:uncharacterized protein LOC106059946 isoform X1 [Biomphalaria glabrata]XP_055871673.1 uncharacterized protein LOC106059946 isoform X1 [Biomphalaria glabrata]